MASLDLQDKYITFIRQTILGVLPDVEIFIFGSRVQGKAKEYSDVDIALRSNSLISFTDILKLKGLFQDSTFPYKVDIVDLNSLDEKFLLVISPDLYKI